MFERRLKQEAQEKPKLFCLVVGFFSHVKTKTPKGGEEKKTSQHVLTESCQDLAPTFLKTPSVPYMLPPTERSYSWAGLRLSQPLKPLRHIPVGIGKQDLLQIFLNTTGSIGTEYGETDSVCSISFLLDPVSDSIFLGRGNPFVPRGTRVRVLA